MAKRNRYKSYAWYHPKTKKLYARVQIRQLDGKMKTYLKPALNITHADQLAEEMLRDYAVRKSGFLEGEKMTFDDLAEWYLENRVVPPIYSEDGVKVSGMRTHHNVKLRIQRLQKYLGKIKIKQIDEDTLFKVKIWLKEQSPEAKPASINRYLEDLRSMLRWSVRKRWLRENPFDFGEKLIDSALEQKRDVVLNKSQEDLILAVAQKSEKTMIYHALLCLIDTGARPSEIYDASTEKAEPVKWKDFMDYDYQVVRLTSYKGKKKEIRFVPVSIRLENAMRELWNQHKKPNKEEPIVHVKSFRRSWNTIRRTIRQTLLIAEKLKVSTDAILEEKIDHDLIDRTREEIIQEDKIAKTKGKYQAEFIENVRMRDLRRSFSTKLADNGVENDLRQRILGHTEAQTTFDYTTANLDLALRLRDKLYSQEV